MVASDMILDVGFNQRFDEVPFSLRLLSYSFLFLRCMHERFLLFLDVPGLGLGIELGTLSLRARLGDA